jgi:hypothetical protein
MNVTFNRSSAMNRIYKSAVLAAIVGLALSGNFTLAETPEASAKTRCEQEARDAGIMDMEELVAYVAECVEGSQDAQQSGQDQSQGE